MYTYIYVPNEVLVILINYNGYYIHAQNTFE